jgi:tetratricopeptide (TPR) repeat protein
MNEERRPFVGRGGELALAQEFFAPDAPSLCVLWVEGEGGVGKTRLLLELKSLYNNQDQVQVAEIIDFGDLALRLSRTVDQEIMKALGQVETPCFEPYRQAYRQVQEARLWRQRQELELQAQAALANCINSLSTGSNGRRLLFLFDTLEQATPRIRKHLAHLLSGLENCVVVMGGRPEAQMAKLLTEELSLTRPGSRVESRHWKGLPEQDGLLYLELATRDRRMAGFLEELGIAEKDLIELAGLLPGKPIKIAPESSLDGLLAGVVEPKLKQMVLRLSGGIPFIIDLAVDWLSPKAIVPRETMEATWAKIRTLAEEMASQPYSADEMFETKSEETRWLALEFESALAMLVLQMPERVRTTILYMAHVYHSFDEEILHYLAGWPQGECQRILRELQEFTFVKPRPDGSVVLHDKMRDMVVGYAWRATDPQGNARRRLSARMDEYFGTKLAGLPARAPGDLAAQTRDSLCQSLLVQQLYHRLLVDPTKGFDFFTVLLSEATRWEMSFGEMLIEFVEGFHPEQIEFVPGDMRHPLSSLQVTFLDIRHGGFLVQRERLDEAREKLGTALDSLEKLLQERHYSLGDDLRDGQLDTLRKRLDEAPIAERQEIEQIALNLEQGYNSLGFCERLRGDWKEAIRLYGRSLAFSDLLRRPGQLGQTLNNMANLYRMAGRYSEAISYGLVSLRLREKLNDPVSTGHSHYVVAMILWETGNTAEAATHIARAREIFEQARLFHRRAMADKYLGYLHFRIGDLDEAKVLLEDVRNYFEQAEETEQRYSELSHTYNILSRIARQEQRMMEAWTLTLKALQLAGDVKDWYKQAEAHLSMAILYFNLISASAKALNQFESELRQYDAEGTVPQNVQTFLAELKGHEPGLLVSGDAKDFLLTWAERHYDRGRQIAKGQGYVALESVYEGVRGNIAFERGDYDKAFHQYLNECRLAAQHKSARLERALNQVVAGRISQLASESDRRKYADYLIDEWRRLSLDNEFPQFIEECQQIKQFLGLPDAKEEQRLLHIYGETMNWGQYPQAAEAAEALLELNRLYRRGEQTAKAMLRVAQAHRRLGSYSAARRYCMRALDLCQEAIAEPPSSDTPSSVHALFAEGLYVMGMIQWEIGNTAESAAYFDQARQVYTDLHDKIGLGRVHRYLGFLRFRIGNHERALNELNKAESYFQKHLSDPALVPDWIDLYNLQSRIWRVRPAVDRKVSDEEAERLAKEALKLAEKLGDNYAQAECLLSLTVLAYRRDGAEGINRYCSRGSLIAQQNHYTLLLSLYRGMEANIAFDGGDYAQAAALYVEECRLGASYRSSRLRRCLELLSWRMARLSAGELEAFCDRLIAGWTDMEHRYPDVTMLCRMMKRYKGYISA